jgi:hypothetical protein
MTAPVATPTADTKDQQDEVCECTRGGNVRHCSNPADWLAELYHVGDNVPCNATLRQLFCTECKNKLLLAAGIVLEQGRRCRDCGWVPSRVSDLVVFVKLKP